MRNMMSVTKLAELTGKDRRTVTERIAGLTATIEGRSHLYNTREALPLIYDIAARDADLGQKLRDEQLREMTERADKLALQNAKLRSEVVSIEDVAGVVEGEYAAVKAALLSIPYKSAGELAVMDDVIEIKKLLDGLLNEALSELSADDKSLLKESGADAEETE